MIVLTNRDPAFLKAAYRSPYIQLIDHERHIKTGQVFVTYDGRWKVWKMSAERVFLPKGIYRTLNAALFFAANK